MCLFTLTGDAGRWEVTAQAILFQQSWVSHHLRVVCHTGFTLLQHSSRYWCGSLGSWEDTGGAVSLIVKGGYERGALHSLIGNVMYWIFLCVGRECWTLAKAHLLILVIMDQGILWWVICSYNVALGIISGPFYWCSWAITFCIREWSGKTHFLLLFLQFDLSRKQVSIMFVCISKWLLKWHKPSIINQLWLSKK